MRVSGGGGLPVIIGDVMEEEKVRDQIGWCWRAWRSRFLTEIA